MTGSAIASREFLRDQAETSFTSALRHLFVSDADVLAVAFVDQEGECVDYCGSVEPYEVRVVGAHLQVVVNNLRPSLGKLALGELGELHVHCERYEYVVRRIDDDYACIVMRAQGRPDEPMLKALDETVAMIRGLAGLAVPAWDVGERGLEVLVRESVGWGYAPEAFVDTDGVLRVDAVLGRWEETGGLTGQPLICFRVHTADGRDATLVHDAAHDRWYRW